MKALFGRWTAAKAAAAAGALAVAGAIGSAVAMSPIIQPPIKWAGGAEFNNNIISGPVPVYTVPAGRNFILTDLMVSNWNANTQGYSLFAVAGGNCLSGQLSRLNSVSLQAGETLHLSLQTGIGFSAGQTLCMSTTASLFINGRGFLFTAAPAS